MNRHMIFAAARFAGLAAIAVTIAPMNVAMAAPANQSTRIFTIGKMTCPTCPITVRTAISRVVGVKRVMIDFRAKTATVTYDPTVTTPTTIAAASSGIGFPARLRGS